jgi:hypothetical protein
MWIYGGPILGLFTVHASARNTHESQLPSLELGNGEKAVFHKSSFPGAYN